MAYPGVPVTPAQASKRRAIGAAPAQAVFSIDTDTSDESLLRVRPIERQSYNPATSGSSSAGMTGVGTSLPSYSAPPFPTTGGQGGMQPQHHVHQSLHQTVQMNHDPTVTAQAEQYQNSSVIKLACIPQLQICSSSKTLHQLTSME